MNMMTIKELLKKYKSIILYLVFGGLTTVVNIGVYGLCYQIFNISNVLSNIIAWFLAVIVAYVTNKIWVFESKTLELKKLIYEISFFFGCRLITGCVDLAIMYLCVDLLHMNALLMKIIANVFVIVSNYIASKFVIFKKNPDAVEE